jgi:hypothetical protein
VRKILKRAYLQVGKILVGFIKFEKILKRKYLQVVKNLGVDLSCGVKILM